MTSAAEGEGAASAGAGAAAAGAGATEAPEQALEAVPQAVDEPHDDSQAGAAHEGSQHFAAHGLHSVFLQSSLGSFSFGSLHFGRLIFGRLSFGSLHLGCSQQVLHLWPASQTTVAEKTKKQVTTHSISFLNIWNSEVNWTCFASTPTTAYSSLSYKYRAAAQFRWRASLRRSGWSACDKLRS